MTNDRKARAARAEQMRKEREKADSKQRNMISVAIVAVVVVLVGVAAWGVYRISESNEKQTEVVEPRNLVESGVPFVPAETVEVAEKAPLVETFEDFLCPACGQFEAMSGPFLRDLAEKGEIEFRFSPFSFLHGQSTNEYSRRSMNLAMCAVDEQGAEAFWPVHEAIFANQPEEGGSGQTDAELLAIAEGAGVAGLDTCVQTQKFVPWIDEIKNYFAKERGIEGTPTLMINGELTEARSPDDLQKAIADASK